MSEGMIALFESRQLRIEALENEKLELKKELDKAHTLIKIMAAYGGGRLS